ncbi:hypothetical protein J0H58_18215 [bacterium]|nr:hypothetical protein [bacterium]
MTAELDPLDAGIDRIRRSEPPADGWPRARRRAARRRRRPALALAAAAAAVLVGLFVVQPAARVGRGDARLTAEVARSGPGPVPAMEPPPAAKTPDAPPPPFGGSPAGVWPAPRLAVAAAAPVLVGTAGAKSMKLGGTAPAGTVGDRIHVWNWEKSPDSRVLAAATVGAFALTPDGTTLVTAEGQVIDLATGAAVRPAWWAGLALRPAWVTLSPDGKTLLALEHDQKVGTARLIDYPAGTERAKVGGLWWAASRAAFSADGKVVALYGSDAHLRVFDATTGAEKAKLAPPFANTIQAVAASADGARVAGSYGGAVRVWDAATGKLVCEPATAALGAATEFRALAFSPDGKRLAGAGSSPLVLWDAVDGAIVHRYPRESQIVAHLRFDAAGATITTVKDYHIYRGPSGRELGVYPTVERWRTDAPERAGP